MALWAVVILAVLVIAAVPVAAVLGKEPFDGLAVVMLNDRVQFGSEGTESLLIFSERDELRMLSLARDAR